ncbi:expressed unknown protein [Seminavis robusta]|uniref:Uncharacterized protein n=1 Tax=Seminavis robusta TaxID=568900 RepID=A0A9N8EKH0_9STRA|nr:expressed unknown protein [Seminavis robusta]|eukprot:Sro1335_g263930.1 n/a (187) ;mRNA; f:25495-26055
MTVPVSGNSKQPRFILSGRRFTLIGLLILVLLPTIFFTSSGSNEVTGNTVVHQPDLLSSIRPASPITKKTVQLLPPPSLPEPEKGSLEPDPWNTTALERDQGCLERDQRCLERDQRCLEHDYIGTGPTILGTGPTILGTGERILGTRLHWNGTKDAWNGTKDAWNGTNDAWNGTNDAWNTTDSEFV